MPLVDTLPLVICGPILRKTTKNMVCVWIALKEARDLTLKIYRHATDGADIIGSAAGRTHKLGAALHVALLQVSGLELQSGQVYLYDIEFDAGQSLSTPGILDAVVNGINKVVYPGFSLPSFVLPGSSPETLKIVHGSCRKPHGGTMVSASSQSPEYFSDCIKYHDNDALSYLDTLILNFAAVPSQRPQQLYLTGDQIYADDVADMVLSLIQKIELEIVGVQEVLPMIAPNDPNLQPLKRHNILNNYARFTTYGTGRNHLMKLSEFYVMYLLVWSDVLWPSPVVAETDFNSYWDGVSAGDGFDKSDVQAADYFRYQNQTLTGFIQTLPLVRRALANIPTYMMFDDHEITDDWYLDQQWAERIEATDLGRRIMQNGLAAFAVFQAWGNTPELFSHIDSAESRIMSLLKKIAAGPPGITDWNSLRSEILPVFNLHGPELEEQIQVAQLRGGPKWFFYLEFDWFQVLALNSRTQRGFFNIRKNDKVGFSMLLSNDSFNEQVGLASSDPKYEFTIILAPAPIIGHTNIEYFQGWASLDKRENRISNDLETWALSKTLMTQMLTRLAKFRRTIVLSGDVHYSFTAAVDCKHRIASTPQFERAKIIQCTCSSLKNSERKTTEYVLCGSPFLGVPAMSEGNTFDFWFDLRQLHFKGWSTAQKVGSIQPFDSEYDIIADVNRNYDYRKLLEEGFVPTVEADREYKIAFIRDGRDDEDRGAGTFDPADVGLVQIAAIHQSRSDYAGMSTAVGYGCIAIISFDRSEEHFRMHHKFWFKPEKQSEVGSWTIHTVDLRIDETF